MKNPILTTQNGIRESLSNMFYSGSACTVQDIEDAVEDSATASELARRLNRLPLFEKWGTDRETERYVRLKATDCWGNRKYFQAEK